MMTHSSAKHIMISGFAIIILLTVFCWLWLWFMIRRPAKWGAIVDKENAFWTSRGLVSASLAERIKGFEKGRGQKILVGAAAVFGTLVLIFLTIWKATK
jgi:hypothetical protein